MKNREWSVLLHSYHTQGAAHDRLRDYIDELLEVLPDEAVASYDPIVIAARFNVKAPTIVEAVAKAQNIFHNALVRIRFPDTIEVVWADAQTVEELDRELQRSNAPQMVGVSEVAGILGVTRQRALEVSRRPDFPKPIAELAAGPVWNRHAVARFLERWPRRRTGRPRSKLLEQTPAKRIREH